MAREGEFSFTPATAIAIFILERIGVAAVGTEDLAAKDDLPEIFTNLGFAGDLVELVHVHIVTSWSGCVPSRLDYPAVVGVAVYMAMQAKKTETANKTTPSPAASSMSPTPLADQTKYLVISELGLKLPLSAAIEDLVYKYTPENGDTPGRLQFSTNSISSMTDSGTACSLQHEPLGMYSVYSASQSNVGTADSQAGTLVTSAGGKFVYYHHAQYACGSTASDSAKVAALIEPLHVAVQNAKPAK